MLRECAGRIGADGWESGWDELTVQALDEGDEIEPDETVLLIEGDYTLFAHLETVYLGSLARRSLVMTNVREVVETANGKPVIVFPARHDHWLVQTGDGWAAHVAGAIGVSTDAQASWWGGRGVGTVPHSLIAAYGGDTVAAGREFAARYRDRVNVTVLVDFHNDSVGDAVAVADALGDDLWGVRLDTSERLVDLPSPTAPTPTSSTASSRRRSRCGRRSMPPATSGCGSSSPAASTSRRSAASRRRAPRSTPTGSARHSSAASSTSPATWSSSRAGRGQRWDAGCGRTRACGRSTEVARRGRLGPTLPTSRRAVRARGSDCWP